MSTQSLNVDGIGEVEVSYTERGAGQPVLLLHGGGGPFTVTAWADLLANTKPARVIVPTHPGFGGTPRPDLLTTVRDLARMYAAFIEKLGLDGVTIIGNSIGGWIAAELVLVAGNRVGSLVLAGATGIDVPGHAVADPFAISLEELSRLSYHDPVKFRLDPSKFTPQQQAGMAANRAALKLYGSTMEDPSLRARLSVIAIPTLAVWGESDGVVDPDYGRAFAAAIPGAKFQLLKGTGHMPQIETPELLAKEVWNFVCEQADKNPAA